MSTGIVYGDSNVSLSSTICTSTFGTHPLLAGSHQSEGILGFHPNVICQICHAPGHLADTCPCRYQSREQHVLSTYATFNFVDAGEQLWYLDSSVASHMTFDDVGFSLKPFALARVLLRL